LIARALSCSGEVVQLPVAAQVLGAVDDGLDAQRDAILEVLLQAGALEEDVHGDQVAVLVDLGLEPAAGRVSACPAEVLAAAEQQFDVLRAAQVHVLAQQRLEERAGVDAGDTRAVVFAARYGALRLSGDRRSASGR
jgi:hypothetical protein